MARCRPVSLVASAPGPREHRRGMDAVTLEALAGGSAALAAAVDRAGPGLFALTRDTRGEVLGARCGGSAERTYTLQADLRHQPPRVRCSCPSRKWPCKHGLALLSRWLAEPQAFQLTGQLEVELPGTGESRVSGPVPRREPLPTASSKDRALERLRAQQQGLQEARRLLEELVASGVQALPASALSSFRERADALGGLHLSGISARLRRLLAITSPEPDASAQRSIARALATLMHQVTTGEAWIERAQARLKSDAGGDEDRWEVDAAVETRLGRVWTLSELRARNHSRRLSLVELAWWREDDVGLQARVDTSALVDLESGAWFLESQIVPLHLTGQRAPKASHEGVLEVEEALLHPGSAPPRVRWRPGAARSRSGTAADWLRLCAHATPLHPIREQSLVDPFRETPLFALLDVREAIRLEDGVGLVDPAGEVLAIDPLATAVLDAWGAPERPFTAAVSLKPDRRERGATLHAVITEEGPVRLGG